MSDVSDQQGSGLPKTFDPAAIEAKWYAHWEANGLFRPERPDAEPFTIVNPPPNVTGSLHIGHALDNTLQDVVVRYERLRGRDALWVVGTDHAGIATQMVVERNLAAEGLKRADLGREAFLDKVWEWKGTSGGAITRQLRRLGCSMDWSREQFTMDPHFTRAVVHVFVALHRRGLIYRAKRLVNWDPVFRSAISDLEVESREVSGHMWHFKYPLEGGRTYRYVERDADGAVLVDEMRDYISIATTRPETMLGDGAVAVHPDDERYRELVGTRCEIPVGPKAQRRLIPIIADDYPDPAFGSGAVKITGAHDANDYGVAQRHGIPMYRLMDEAAAMRADGPSYAEGSARARAIAAGEAATPAEIDSLNLVPESYRGLDRYEARRRVVADIDADGLLIRVEDKAIMQPFGDRSNVVIEPMLTDQWYVDAEKLAAPAIEAVRSGAVEIVPKSWEKTFFNWMQNIQPWCVSRQLWWGHRIPVWYGPPLDADGHISFVGDIGQGIPFVAETAGEAVELARAFYAVDLPITASDDAGAWVADNKARYLRMAAGEDPDFAITLVRDPDVLDTWFSSALWPFATLGWPETDAPLATRHYPNDLLISGFDILFFWDARMLMQGIEFLGTPPWKRLYLHGLVRAADGQKMSKSKGNVVDPLGLIDRFGADALRFFMAAMESQGRDVKMDEARVEGYRNFATKLWNAVRFAQGNGISASDSIAAPAAKLPLNRWLIGEVAATAQAIDKAMAELRFDAAANAIYAFVWDRFCDWYLELSKPVFAEGGDAAEETRRVAGWAIDQILVMLHPFMPFITEELWHAQGARPCELIVARWPDPQAEADPAAAAEIDWLIALIGSVRATKAELGIAPGARLTAFVADADDGIRAMARRNGPMLDRLARLDSLSFDPPPPGAAAALVIGGATYSLPLEGVIDVAAERARLDKALAAAVKERDSLGQRLANPAFTEKAKPEAVEKARADHAAKAAEAERLEAARGRLG